MILTEEYALGKFCHKTMTPHALRREEDLFCPAKCMASECMAWRWYEKVPAKCPPKETAEVEKNGCSACKYEFTENPAASKPWTRFNDEIWVCPICKTCQQDITFHPEERRGFCGLAGKPGPSA